MDAGRFSRTAAALLILSTSTGPTNFLDSTWSGRSLDSQTLCPGRYVGVGVRRFTCLCTWREERWGEERTRRQMFLQWQKLTRTDGTATSLSWYLNSSGWYPRDIMNGETPVAADTLALCAHSTHVRKELQAVGLRDTLECAYQALICSLDLTVRLGVVAGGQAY